MRIIGKENDKFLYGMIFLVGSVGWVGKFTVFEWVITLAAAYICYLLICVTDYLHLIGEVLEEQRDQAR